MEAVQNNFLSKVQDKKFTSLNYWDMPTTLRINSQERRRERYMAIFLWKVCQVYHMDFMGVDAKVEQIYQRLSHYPQASPEKPMSPQLVSRGLKFSTYCQMRLET